jgi:hypothetical protein
MPCVGQSVTVAYLATRVGGVIERFDESRRQLVVVTDEGEAIRFDLSRATGRFYAEGDPTSARLSFDVPNHPG